MHGKAIALILTAVAFSAAGQLLLKSGAQRLAALAPLEFLRAAVRDAHVLGGLAAWAASTVCWLYVLRATPLSRAYGATSLTYVIVFMTSVYLFGEQIRRLQVMGTMLIIIGVICLFSGD